MSNPQTNKGRQLPPDQGLPCEKTEQASHFVQAREIIKTWPEWKRNIRCAPTSTNSNQSTQVPDKS
jgi:hypothetical protein